MHSDSLILASSSSYRADILRSAGMDVVQFPASIDERQLESSLPATTDAGERAEYLACAKARAVSTEHSGSLVIGCDQILSLDDRILHKVASRDEATERLRLLSGKTHYLHSAIALCRNSQILWRHTERCTMTMRSLSMVEIDDYLTRAGSDVLNSVGVYQIEGIGSELFESYDGELSSIIGLPLTALQAALKRKDIVSGTTTE